MAFEQRVKDTHLYGIGMRLGWGIDFDFHLSPPCVLDCSLWSVANRKSGSPSSRQRCRSATRRRWLLCLACCVWFVRSVCSEFSSLSPVHGIERRAVLHNQCWHDGQRDAGLSSRVFDLCAGRFHVIFVRFRSLLIWTEIASFLPSQCSIRYGFNRQGGWCAACNSLCDGSFENIRFCGSLFPLSFLFYELIWLECLFLELISEVMHALLPRLVEWERA